MDMSKWLKSLLIIMTVAIGAMFAVPQLKRLIEGFYEGFETAIEGHPLLPSCESAHGLSDAKNAIKASPFAKTLSIEIVAISEPTTLSITPDKVTCRAMALLNDGRQTMIDYSFMRLHDPSLPPNSYYAKAELEDEK